MAVVWKKDSATSSTQRPSTARKDTNKNGGKSFTFDAWCHRKDVFDKGLELLAQLDSYRWEKDEEYEHLTAALVAIDESLEVDADAEVRKARTTGASKTMFEIWKRSSMEKHALTQVPLSKRNEAEISETVKQYATKTEVMVEGRMQERLVLPQMTYMYPALPKKKGDQVKPLTKDQKVQNAIFLSQLRHRWLAKRDQVVAKAGKVSIALLDSFLTKEQKEGSGGGGGGGSQQQRPTAAELKRRALHSLGISKLNKWVEEDVEKVEEDAKEKTNSKRHEAAHAHDAFVRGKKALELWLPSSQGPAKLSEPPRPPSFVFATGGRGKGSSSAVPLRSRQNTSIASSTVDMMRTSGLRVVHALSAGRQGQKADLEKSRAQLEREGFVSKRNYGEQEEYKDALTTATSGTSLEPGERVRVKVKQQQQQGPASSPSAGKGMRWVTATVERRTQTRFQVFIPDNPCEGEKTCSGSELRKLGSGSCVGTARVEGGELVRVQGSDEKWSVKRDLSTYEVSYEVGEGSSSHQQQSSSTKREVRVYEREDLKRLSAKQQRQAEADESYKEWVEQKRSREQARECLKHTESPDELVDLSTGQLADEPAALAHWKAVGKHLKVVERSLLDEWFEWSKGFEVTYYVCQVLWDSFEPIGDDVHSQAYSLARSTLGHVLRPSLGYKAAADKIVQRKWRAASGGGGGGDGDGPEGDLEDAPADEIAELKMFDRKDLRGLLRELGIELRPDQLRLVVDCFDVEGDRGQMDVDCFLEFTGPHGPRDKVDARQRLKKRIPPVWESTCPKTGLSNAFRVTTAPESAQDALGDARVKILSKKNGEKRRQVELKERQRRIAILRHFDEINDDEEEEDDYGSDEEDEDNGYGDDEFEGADGGGPKSSKGGKKSTVAQWLENNGAEMKERRKAALSELMRLSRLRRDEAELQSLLETGQPPGAPVFYCAGPSDEEVTRVGETLEESLLLCWEAAPNSLVAFFSVEMSGSRGSREQRENVFHEIFRDPDSAKGKFRYMTWIRDLQPGTSYAFRIRAFNGFGPGPYNWEVFTTRPRRPNKPSVLNRSPTSVTLRWAGADSEAEGLVAEAGDCLEAEFRDFTAQGSGVVVPAASVAAALRLAATTSDALLDFLGNRAKTSAAAVVKAAAASSSSGSNGGGLATSTSASSFAAGSEGEEMNVSVLDALEGSGIHCLLNWRDLRALLLRAAQNGHSLTKKGGGYLAPSPSTSQVRYNIEQCQSVTMGQWRKVLTTKFDHATVSALESGKPHRFRVVALNANGLESKKSPSIVTTTLLETPPPPRVAPSRPRSDVGGSCLKLVWDPGAVFGMGLCQREQRKQNIDRILNSWTHEGADDEGAVSVAAAFRRQQTYHPGMRGGGGGGSGCADDEESSEAVETVSEGDVLNLMRDLGLGQQGKGAERDATTVLSDAKMSEVKDLCAEDEDGFGVGGLRLSLFDLKQWWTRDTMTYEIRRDGGSPVEFLPQGKVAAANQQQAHFSATVAARTGGGGGASATATRRKTAAEGCSVLCYRGTSEDGRSCLVAGLEPNFSYRFTLRLVTSQSLSAASRLLEAHTSPAPMERPVVISDEFLSDPKCVALKWYPGRNGAHKYVVECKLVEALDWERDRSIEAAQHKLRAQGWRKCFEARDNTARLLVAGGAAATSGEGLLPNSVYHLRVTALNAHDVSGPPSDHTLCRTSVVNRQGGGSSGGGGGNPLLGGAASSSSRRQTSPSVLKPSNAHQHFTVECRGDIVVGDTVICTEQLFVGVDGKLVKGAGTQRSIHLPGGGGAGAAASANQRGGSAETGSAVTRVFIGERTIAAHVVKDSYRTPARNEMMGGGGSAGRFQSRMLRLEVIWSTCSSEDSAGFLLTKDDVIERDEAALSEYEVFRAEWKEEKRRLPEAKERRICRKLLVS